jgi:phosphoadenosine phosphosulfate reductase
MRVATIADTTRALLGTLIRERFAGRIALVSSFGTESAVLLHMVAAIDRALPVIFLDIGTLFPETLAYRRTLAARLRLADLRYARPDLAVPAAVEPQGGLWRGASDRCCELRTGVPLVRALDPFDAWISGRTRVQDGERHAPATVEFGSDWRIKVNPVAHWTEADIAAYFTHYDLPPYPLHAGPRAGTGRTERGTHRAPAHPERASA